MKLPASSPSPRGPHFSPQRSEIFRENAKIALHIGQSAFPDFYALLETPREASAPVLDEAIIDLGAQLLSVALSRGAGPRMQVAAQFLPLLRAVLLDPTRRASYDAALRAHETNAADAPDFEAWRAHNFTLGERWQQKSQSWRARVRQNLASQPYL